MKRLSIFALVLFSFSIAVAQEKKPITHEEMWLMKRVGTPEISPDGKWTIYGLTEPSYDEKEEINDVWIVSTDGSATPRRITSGKAGESGYAWSPDGKYIAFVAKRDADEQSQIYLLNFKEGGEAQRFTNLSTGASSPKWSADGKMIMFTSSVYPSCYVDSLNKKKIEEKKKQKYKARVYTTFPVRNFDKWLDEKQTHIFVQSLEVGSKAKDVFTDVAISKLDGFRSSGATLSKDGKEIIFAATIDANTAAYQDPTTNLYKVAIAGGDATQLTNDKNDYGNPKFSDDGKYLFYYTSLNNNYKVYNLNRLARMDWPSMQNKMVISEKLDRPINDYLFFQNQVYMSVEDQGRDKIYSLPMNGGEPKVITTGQAGCYGNISVSKIGTPVLVSNFESCSMPPEIVKINTDGSHTFLTKVNAEKLSKLDLPAVETVWFTSTRGKQIKSLLVRPAGFDATKKYPLFVVMHGGPASAAKETWSYRWNVHLLARPGYVLLLTDYTGSTGYGEKFAQDIQNDPFKGPGDEINEAAADAIKRYPFIDGSKQACGGGSYGGHLASWMEATTTHYKCLVCHAGLVNNVTQWGSSDGIYSREVINGGVPWQQNETWINQNPYHYADKFKTPMMITVGEQDFRVPINNSLENWHILQRQKVPGKLIVFPEENHWISKPEDSRFFYKELHAWLADYLK
jgi:dipeptidyl aminopeptidase/acylaminoacyl peptidase